eukprot:CAMPEP_0195147724 /NCGR_PEP_ID=MMETSP0448-20130528/173931_1 /TAXON_ID=66468 /ORGANISM="Heterocapsa triquestra, Strain CCMP 448" /LENGTH=87 /DNA_ID=CAMNT_0040186313 /DNA_START=109 /DNA_END=368 /DNA_ORIENTATION=+
MRTFMYSRVGARAWPTVSIVADPVAPALDLVLVALFAHLAMPPDDGNLVMPAHVAAGVHALAAAAAPAPSAAACLALAPGSCAQALP